MRTPQCQQCHGENERIWMNNVARIVNVLDVSTRFKQHEIKSKTYQTRVNKLDNSVETI